MIGKLPDGWRVEKLGDIGKIFTGSSAPQDNKYFDNGIYPFVRVSDLSKKRFDKNLNNIRDYINDICLLDTKQTFAKKGTILFAKSGMSVVNNHRAILEIDSYIVSHLCAVYINNETTRDYIFYLLCKTNMVHHSENEAYPSLKTSTIKSIPIPIPPLQQQEKIVRVLDLSSGLVEKQKELLQKYDLFLKSKFIEMFGDPILNPMGWEVVKLGKYGTLARGKSAHRPRNAPFLYGGKYPFIQTGDITKGNSIYIKDYKQTYSEDGIKQSKLFPKNTIAITIAANIGDAKILNFDCYFPDSVVGFNVKNPLFVSSLFAYYKDKLEQQATKTAQKNINLQVLNNLDVLYPPITLQNKFAQIVEKVEQIKNKESAKLQQLQTLHNSLMSKAFKGEIK